MRLAPLLLAAGLLAGCGGVPADTPDPTSSAEASAMYCAIVMRAEDSLSDAMLRAAVIGDVARQNALHLQLLDYVAGNPGGCFPAWWAEGRRKAAAELRAELARLALEGA